MTLAPDIIELAQQIADDLKERIDGLPMFYGSIFTKSDCCKNLIESLLGKHKIDTLLESSPPKDAQSLRERYSRLMSCFDQTGELLNQSLSLTTVVRYVNDLIKELRDIAKGSKQSTTAAKQKNKRILKKKPIICSVKDGLVPPEIPTERVPLAKAAKWFGCDYRTLKKDIKSGKIKARCFSDRRWEFDLDQVTEFNPSVRADADPTERNKTQ